VFRRRVELNLLQKLRETVWPRIGWKRAFQYGWRRVWRLSGTPHAVALGVAAGVFASFTPFLGFHLIIAFILAWVFRGNLIASAFGTFMGNPVTYPPIWFATYDLGHWLLGTSAYDNVDLSTALTSGKAFDMILPVLVPMAAGCVPLGLGGGLVAYFMVRSAVETYQRRRRERLAERAMTRHHGLEPYRPDNEQGSQ
jgi:uncharacterized protein (DUF2062 family)